MRLIFAALFCVMVLPSAFAEKLPAPVGKPVLTTTPWYSGKVRFDGVSLNKLMDLVGAKGKSARVLALNDYTTIVPIDDFDKFPVILALKMNGEYMRIRDKGPLFIVYPYDSSPELQNQIYYSRSAWQVSKIIIE